MATPYRDEPARPKVEETREELLERVRAEQEVVLAVGGRDLDRDPSTRRGFTRLLLAVLATGAIVGYAVTLVVVGVLRGWEQGVQAGFAGALVLAVISALLLAEGEDGRIARWVDARTRRGGSPTRTHLRRAAMAGQERDPASGAQKQDTEQEQWTDNPQPGGPSQGRTEPHEPAAPADPGAG